MNQRQQARVRAYRIASYILEKALQGDVQEEPSVIAQLRDIAEALAWRGERIQSQAAARDQFRRQRQHK